MTKHQSLILLFVLVISLGCGNIYQSDGEQNGLNADSELAAAGMGGSDLGVSSETEQAEEPITTQELKSFWTDVFGGGAAIGGNGTSNVDPPMSITTRGPLWTATTLGSTGTIYYPTTGNGPFPGISLCGGFLNMGPEMAGWGSFYASWGIVTVITSTFPTDLPDMRGSKLRASIDELKRENNNPLSPLFGKMSGAYGTSGYSMGGGGTTLASLWEPSLKTSVAMAPWGASIGMRVPTLFLCGDLDFIAGVSTPMVSLGTPALLATVGMASHLSWFGPTNATANFALAWQKVYLEGDTRWKSFLSQKPLGITSVRPQNL